MAIILYWDNPVIGLSGRPVSYRLTLLKSIYERSYRRLLELLVEARQDAGVTQQQLADRLQRPQSFISKIENGDRRLDVVEFLELCRLLGADPAALMKQVEGLLRRR